MKHTHACPHPRAEAPTLDPRTLRQPAGQGPKRARLPAAAAWSRRLGWLALGVGACVGLTGCFGFLKPAAPTTRYFVLAPVPATPAESGPPSGLGVGVGPVTLASYLFNTSLATRAGTNEIVYLQSALWGERLDRGIQRVLAANLSVLLPTDRIRLSSWRSDEVSAGVYVNLEQFDVDATGRGVLVAWWRILSPDGTTLLKAGEARLTRAGPAPQPNPEGAVGTLNALLADLSRDLARALLEKVPGPDGKPAPR